MSFDAIGIVSKDTQKSVEFFQLLGVSLTEAGSPDHLQGTTPSGVRIMTDSGALIKKINPNWKEPTGSGVMLCFKQESAQQVNELFSKIPSIILSLATESRPGRL